MNILLFQIPTETAERGFFSLLDISITIAICILMLFGFVWYLLRVEARHEKEIDGLRDELKIIRKKREEELKETIDVMKETQLAMQGIILSNQNLPLTLEKKVSNGVDRIINHIDSLKRG